MHPVIPGNQVIDIARQSVLYGLYSTEPKGVQPRGWELYTPCGTQLPCYMHYISERRGTCTLLGSKRRCVLSRRILVLHNDELYWYVYMSPGQCYNKNTVPPSRYCKTWQLQNLAIVTAWQQGIPVVKEPACPHKQCSTPNIFIRTAHYVWSVYTAKSSWVSMYSPAQCTHTLPHHFRGT